MNGRPHSKRKTILLSGALLVAIFAVLVLSHFILKHLTPPSPSQHLAENGKREDAQGTNASSELPNLKSNGTPAEADIDPAPSLPGNRRTVEIHHTDFKYPYIRVEKNEEGVIQKTMVADHLIIQVDETATNDSFTSTIQGSPLIIRKTIVPSRLYLISLAESDEPQESTLEIIQEHLQDYDHLVTSTEPDYIVYRQGIPNDSDFGRLWGLNNNEPPFSGTHGDISAPEAWDIATSAQSVVVAVIDTGIDYNHEDLAANIWLNPGEIPDNNIDDDNNGYIDDVHGYDFYNEDGDPMDDHFHGTHCAGTIGAIGNNAKGVTGVAWRAQLMAVKFLDNNARGVTSDAILAVQYAYDNGADLTSNSWGGKTPSDILSTTIQSAGKLFIAAAGNSSQDNDTTSTYPASFPLDNIISVAATDREDRLAFFSNYGSESVDLAAPGVSILSTLPENRYGPLSGTSMATPHVSGACALLLSQDPSLTPSQIKQHLLESSDTLASLTEKAQSEGRLNLERLLLGLSDAPPNITSEVNLTAFLTEPFSYQITTTSPATWFDATPLPSGMSIDTATGLISGTPQVGGSYAITLTAGNAKGLESATLNLNIIAANPIITSPLSASAQQAKPFIYEIIATSNPVSYDATNLPDGLSVNTQFGTISGTPEEHGIFEVILSATNSGGTGLATLNLTVAPPDPPEIISPLNVSANVFETFSYQITATPNPTQYNALSLPNGLTLNSTQGTITGVPQQLGIFNIEISASNESGQDTETLVLTVNPSGAPLLGGTLDAQGQVGQPFDYTIQASNLPQSFNATELPPGLNVDTQTGLISGIPTTAGTFLATIDAENTFGTASRVLHVTILPQIPQITSSLQIDAIVRTPIQYSITSVPDADSYSANNLPEGLSLNPITGNIAGQIDQVGIYTPLITATNTGGSNSANLVFNILPEPPQFVGATEFNFAVNETFEISLATSPTAISFNATALPSGLNLNTATGDISGSIDTEGIYSFDVSANNAGGSTPTTLTLNITRRTVINTISPIVVNPQETLTITGSGFTGATEIYFSDRFNNLIPADSFTVLSDTHIEVIVPYLLMIHDSDYSHVIVNSPHGLAVTFPQNSIEVSEGYNTSSAPVRHIIVQEGGALFGGGANHKIMIKKGGFAKLNGGSSSLFFVDSEGFLNLSDIESDLQIFHTEDALIFEETEISSSFSPTFKVVKNIHVTQLDELLYVRQTPQVTSPLQVNTTVGQAFTYQIRAEDTSFENFTYSSGALPEWLSFDSTNGALSGYPTDAANHMVELSVTNNEGTTNFIVSITVSGDPVPVILGDNRVLLDSSTPFHYTISTANDITSFDATGLPSGLTLNTSTGAITGTPTASGVYPVTFTAFNSFGSSSRDFTFFVDESPLAITAFGPTPLASGTELTVQGRGFEKVTSAIFVNRINEAVSSTDLIVQSDDSISITMPSLDHVWYNESPVILSSPDRSTVTFPDSSFAMNASGTIGEPYTIVKSGVNAAPGISGGYMTYVEAGGSVSGGYLLFLEDGATADMEGRGYDSLIFKSPNATVLNPGDATVYEVNSLSLSLVSQELLNVFDLPIITSEDLIANVGDTINYQIKTSRFLVEGTYNAIGLPDGLSISTRNGFITGIPTETGSFLVELQATGDDGTGTKTVTFNIFDTPLPRLTSGYRLDVRAGDMIHHQLQATHSPTAFNAAQVPPGLNITQTGLLTGTLSSPSIWSIPLEIENQYGATEVIFTIAADRPVPIVNSIPTATTIGATFSLGGIHLDQVTEIHFTNPITSKSVQILDQSNSSLEVVTPDFEYIYGSGLLVSLFGPGGASVVIPSTMTVVEDSQFAGGGGIYFVSSEGSLTSAGAGGILVYAQSGAHVDIGGAEVIFAENESTIDLTGVGEECTVIYAPNAKLINPDNVTLIPVHDLQYSNAPDFLHITPIPILSSSNYVKAFQNIPFYYAITASNYPTSFNATTLPPGLSFNSDIASISGSPLVSGTFPIELSIENYYGTTIAILEIEIGSPYDYWKENTFASLDGGSQNPMAQDRANPDGDGYDNMLEYALGTNPFVKDLSWNPIEVISMTGDTIEFRTRKRKGTTSTDGINIFNGNGIRYTIQHSDNLKTWNSGPNYFETIGAPIDHGDGTESITFSNKFDLSTEKNEFFRIHVQRID